MRLRIVHLAVAFCLTAPVFAGPPSGQTPANVEEDVLGIQKKPTAPEKPEPVAESANSADPSDGSTTFNGITVPPLKEIKGDAFDDEIKDGYWYVTISFIAAFHTFNIYVWPQDIYHGTPVTIPRGSKRSLLSYH